MKKLLIILLLFTSYQTSSANESCRNIDPTASKNLNNQVYFIIMKQYNNIKNDIDKLIYINAVSKRVSYLNLKYTSDFANCTISWILYRLHGNKNSLARSLENIDKKKLEHTPLEIQSQIDASKNSTF